MKNGKVSGWPAAFALALAVASPAALGGETKMLAPGWGQLGYEPPQPGAYELPVIRDAGGGEVFTSDGKLADLGDFLHGKITILSFIYTSCDDINGCPLSIFVLHTLQDRLKKENPEIARNLRLISYSFDIENDTPEVLREYGMEHHGGHDGQESHAGHAAHREHGGHKDHAGHAAASRSAEWLFMVASSKKTLDPVLKAYSQFVIPELDEQNEKTGQLSHLLRVFLIDKQGKVRNIYSPSFLHPEILLADVKNLLLMDAKS